MNLPDLEKMRILWQGSVEFVECTYLMGFSILREHLTTIVKFMVEGTSPQVGRKGRYLEVSQGEALEESITFFQGTGLELTITEYGLEVDPWQLRETFLGMLDQLKRGVSSSSSPITQVISFNGASGHSGPSMIWDSTLGALWSPPQNGSSQGLSPSGTQGAQHTRGT